ncbi:class II aldolase/adducin family protein [Sphingobium sp.]|uniref:class II aldolase/adducin family protein n=1 Tax=Sphingobium sp. TaxID=1912891 RepID=UPI0028BE9437|nr:class II aldolase/adducin family protein [Sphingobium sp.]
MGTVRLAACASLRDKVSPEEWALRVDLAACYRLMAHYGMTDLVYNHITARVPDGQDHILINPYGFHYEEITASSLYKIDLEGNVILQPDTDYGVNHAGYIIHSAVHGGREDAACVIHTHTRASMAVSAMKCGLLPISQTSMRFYDRMGYHDFEGPAVNAEERARLVTDLGRHDAMMLRNHGTLVLGRSVAEAFSLAYFLEMACKAQVDAMSSGADLIIPEMAIAEQTAETMAPRDGNQIGQQVIGEMEWPAMLRLLDRRDPSYAQ